jgi:hypothetical protein
MSRFLKAEIVRTRDKERDDLAVKIMKVRSGRDVHVHGWSE